MIKKKNNQEKSKKMSNLKEYTERVDLYWGKGGGEKPLHFNFRKDSKKNIDHYLKWKEQILMHVYQNDESLSIRWYFLDEEEKVLYSDNSENYKKKYILLFEMELFLCFLVFLYENFEKIYPVLWKDDILFKDYFSNLYPKIKINIQLRNLLLDIKRLNQYYLTTFEKNRVFSITEEVKKLEKKIQKRFIPVESFMKLFYKTDFQKINSYDIRREIFSYL